jgi:hypothetical protein
LVPIEHTLSAMQENIDKGRPLYNPLIISTLDSKVTACKELLTELRKKLELISPGLTPIHDKLVSLRRSIRACEAKSKVHNLALYLKM